MTEPTTALDAKMTERAEQLDLSWTQIADAAGISTAHLLNFRKGRANISARKRRQIELKILWESRSIDRVIDGEEPIEKRGYEADELMADLLEVMNGRRPSEEEAARAVGRLWRDTEELRRSNSSDQ